MLLACGTVSAQTKSQSPTPPTPADKEFCGEIAEGVCSLDFPQEQEITQERKVARGQQKIDPTRAREIQEALIREHYLDGTASGTWDAKSQSAMQRYQADNGWQSKSVPDSRALIKMGLGPDHEHLLNPESAMTSQPEAPHATPMLDPIPAMETPPQK